MLFFSVFLLFILVIIWLLAISSCDWAYDLSGWTCLVYIFTDSIRDYGSDITTFLRNVTKKFLYKSLQTIQSLAGWLLSHKTHLTSLDFSLDHWWFDGFLYIWCVLKAKTFSIAVSLAVSALRNLTFGMWWFEFDSIIKKWTNLVDVFIVTFRF